MIMEQGKPTTYLPSSIVLIDLILEIEKQKKEEAVFKERITKKRPGLSRKEVERILEGS